MNSQFETRLAPYLGRDDMSIEELVDGAGELLEVVAPEQTRHKVSDRPDVRTIRYYTSQGLLGKPVSYHGGRARYDDEHLLRLVLIKQMQAEHKTLRQIRHELDGVTRADVLESMTSQSGLPQLAPRPATKTSSLGTSGQLMRRFSLGADASVDVAAAALDDADRRAELAARLRELADALESEP